MKWHCAWETEDIWCVNLGYRSISQPLGLSKKNRTKWCFIFCQFPYMTVTLILVMLGYISDSKVSKIYEFESLVLMS